MIARVKVYAPNGTTARTADVGQGAGILPTVGLSFSVEVGGGGGCQFTALSDDLDALTARDSVIRVQLETAPATWTDVAAYTLRPPFRRDKVGRSRVQCNAVAILEQWASEAVIFPEYAGAWMPQGAGVERALGWQSSAYQTDYDAGGEPWSGCYETARTTMPSESAETGAAWPTGTGAAWISITGASDEAERKLFRTKDGHALTITTAGPVRMFIASDSPGTLYVAGEPVLQVFGGEPGKEPIIFQQADLYMEPGDYHCAFDTDSIWDTGGDGVDPVIIAIATLDADGDPDAWLLVSNDTDWVACRRDADPPDNDPPGPTPGETLAILMDEASARGASGWEYVTKGFDWDVDTYDNPWATVVIERLVRYGSDTMWSVLRMLSETSEVDTWMGPDLVLHAANSQGIDRTSTVTLTTAHIASMSDTWQPDEGTYAMAQALDGWTDGITTGIRREYGMETGTAITRAVAKRIVESALAENGRWDASARLAPGAPVPLVAYHPGDRIGLTYSDAPPAVDVLSVSATAGQGGLLWDLELAEVVW